MAISKIKSGSITADSITEAKIADAAVENEHLNTNIITGQTELAESAASTDVLLVFDTSTGTLKKILASNVGVTPPTVSSISPTNVDSKDSATTTTFTVTGTGFTTGTTAKLRNNSGADISFNTVTRDSSTQLTCVLNNSLITPEGVTDEPYDIVVTGGNGLIGILENQINVDQRPVFVTAAGSLGTVLNALVSSTTFTIEATDPESAGAVRFDVVGGSLPTGSSLNSSTGVISTFSAVGADTTSNFTIQASDVDSNVSFRDFSITVNAPVSESFTSSGTFSVPVGLTAVDVLVVAGGGAGAIQHSGGGGAGGLIFLPGFPVTPGGTVSVTVGNGGQGLNGPQASEVTQPANARGQDSVFGTLTAKGGGFGGSYKGPGISPTHNGDAGGSGGGGGTNCTPSISTGGTATQPTQPGQSGAYGFGNAGGAGFGPSSGVPWYTGGGGGGAGAAGGGGGPGSGNGGAGLSYTIADGTTPVFYAGGGGGGSHGVTPSNPQGGGLGGQGGGGRGNTTAGSPPSPGPGGASGTPGQANKGGGGGSAAGLNVGNEQSGQGGSGIVIVRY